VVSLGKLQQLACTAIGLVQIPADEGSFGGRAEAE
jgi:hypothetical protein